MELSVIVPTFNEGPNVAELVRRIGAALAGTDVEIVFVDDSTEKTPDVSAQVADAADFPVRLIHRDDPDAGLADVLDQIDLRAAVELATAEIRRTSASYMNFSPLIAAHRHDSDEEMSRCARDADPE